MVDPVTAVAITGAVLNVAGGLFGASKQKKAAREQNRKISQLMTDVANYRKEKLQNIQNEQLQTMQRNVNVMSSSGFEMGSFDRLNTWLQTQNERELKLQLSEINVQLSEINAGRPITPSSTATGIGIATQGFQTFAGLGGFNSIGATPRANNVLKQTNNKTGLNSNTLNYLGLSS